MRLCLTQTMVNLWSFSVGTRVAVTVIRFTHRILNNQSEVSSEPRFLRKSMSYWEPADPRTPVAIMRVTSVDTL